MYYLSMEIATLLLAAIRHGYKVSIVYYLLRFQRYNTPIYNDSFSTSIYNSLKSRMSVQSTWSPGGRSV